MDCDITMRDLQAVGESFKSTLRGVYHARIEYPEPSAAERAEAEMRGVGAAVAVGSVGQGGAESAPPPA